MKKPQLHDQDWRDFQPVADPDSDSERFKAALKRAKERVKRKSSKAQTVPRRQSETA